MISYIKWEILHLEPTSIIILTNSWIGYELIINEIIYSHLIQLQQAELFTYHSISENGQSLFGFLGIEERHMFKELIKISWVGGRVAQNILSLGSNRLKKAILEDDKKTIESIKWVWKKMAEKIVLELSDKDIIKNHIWMETEKWNFSTTNTLNTTLHSEIITTLSLMWYQQKKVEEMLSQLPSELTTLETILPYIIKNI